MRVHEVRTPELDFSEQVEFMRARRCRVLAVELMAGLCFYRKDSSTIPTVWVDRTWDKPGKGNQAGRTRA